MHNIIILDDHPVVIEALKSIAKKSKKICFLKGFETETELFQYLKESDETTDCIFLDIHLKNERDGVDICKTLKEQYPDLKVIIFSSFTQKSLVLSALKYGANGYLLKTGSLDEINQCIEAVTEDKIYIDKNLSSVFTSSNKSTSYDYIPKLTRREKEILKLILEENTSSQIAEKLFISLNTVETHRANLFSKTGVKNVAGLIKVALYKNLLQE